jgi:fumarate hydratase subunit beta
VLKLLETPITEIVVRSLDPGAKVLISGWIFAGRDAVLPKLARLIESGGLVAAGIDLQGAVIFHTAVSPAGVGPTSSNKHDIESTIPALSKAGVKIHLGKGRLSDETVGALNTHNSVFAVIPPVTALLESRVIVRKVVAFPEEGMEALHLLNVKEFPCIVAVAHGQTIYDEKHKSQAKEE